MYIEHIAIWTHDLERLRAFYQDWFAAQAGSLYTNPRTGFQSYFLTFASGVRLEIMHMPGIPASQNDPIQQFTGYIHLAIMVGPPSVVDDLTARLAEAGYTVAGQPRRTGDGYYESVILDPDGNRVELVGERA